MLKTKSIFFEMSLISDKFGSATDLIRLVDNDLFLVGTSKGYIIKYNHHSLDTPLETLRACKGSIRRMLLIDNDHCLVCTAKGKLFAVDLTGQQDCGKVKGSLDAVYTAMTLLSSGPQGVLLALGTEDGDIHCVRLFQEADLVFHMDTASAKTLSHHDDYISELVWVAPKKTLLAISGDGVLSAISVKESKEEITVRVVGQSRNYDQDLTALVLLPAEGKLLAAGMLGWVGMFRWNYWGSTCASLKKNIHKEAPITQLHIIDEDLGIALSTDGEGLLRLIATKPLDGAVMIVAQLDESIERSLVFSNGADRLVIAITASGNCLHPIIVSSTVMQKFVQSLSESLSTVKAQENSDDSNLSESDDSDKDEMPESKRKRATKKNLTMASSFFADLD